MDTLNELIKKITAEIEGSEERITKIQEQIEKLSNEQKKERGAADILKQALANIAALKEEIKETSKEEKIVEEKQPIQEEKDSKLKFNTVQKAKARLCQLGVAVKSKIPTAADIKEKLASAAISAGYRLETTRDNIENFTSELIERFTEKREKYEQKITESKKAKEAKEAKRTVEEAQYESDNILNFNPRQPEATKSSKLGIVSKKVIDTLKLTNIDLKIEKAFLEAGISVKNYVEKTTDIINNKVEKIRSIPSNAIEKYQQWKQGRIDKRTELQNQINSLKGMKARVLNAQDPIAEQLVEQPAKTM